MDRQDRRRALQAALSRLGMIIEGVQISVILSDDGLALAAHPADAANAPLVAAVAATLGGSAERALGRLEQGGRGLLLLEGEKGSLLSLPAGPVTLALVITPDASLGHLLFAAQKTAEEIAAVLAPG